MLHTPKTVRPTDHETRDPAPATPDRLAAEPRATEDFEDPMVGAAAADMELNAELYRKLAE
jgi:hypothetical protein